MTPANTVMSTTGLANAYSASNSAADASAQIMAVGAEISSTEYQILARIDALAPTPIVSTTANLVGNPAKPVVAALATAKPIGALSVPPSWVPGALGLRPVALSSAASALGVDAACAQAGLFLAAAASAGGRSRAARGDSLEGHSRTASPGRHHKARSHTESVCASVVVELWGLVQLRDAGILTAADFDRQKQRLLGE